MSNPEPPRPPGDWEHLRDIMIGMLGKTGVFPEDGSPVWRVLTGAAARLANDDLPPNDIRFLRDMYEVLDDLVRRVDAGGRAVRASLTAAMLLSGTSDAVDALDRAIAALQRSAKALELAGFPDQQAFATQLAESLRPQDGR